MVGKKKKIQKDPTLEGIIDQARAFQLLETLSHLLVELETVSITIPGLRKFENALEKKKYELETRYYELAEKDIIFE